jgi:hypothetical protein
MTLALYWHEHEALDCSARPFTCERASSLGMTDNSDYTKSSIHVPPIPDRNYKNQQNPSMHLIDNPVIADAYSPCFNGLQFLASRRKWILTKALNPRRNPLLDFTRQLPQLPKRDRLKLNAIGHDQRLLYNPSFFLTVSQGIVLGSFSELRAAAISISSSSFSRS